MSKLGKSRSFLLAFVVLAIGASAPQAETKVHWYGQSAFKIETPNGGVILIDPWLTVPINPDKNSVAKLGRVDYILITHGHGDHVGQAVEIAKKTGAVLVAPHGLQINMKSVLGYPEKQATSATGSNVGGTMNLPKAGAKLTIVNAIHSSELTPPMAPGPGHAAAIDSGNPVGYVLQIDGGPTIYHTGDTDVYTDMKLIPEFYKVDLMLACIGGHFTMDAARRPGSRVGAGQAGDADALRHLRAPGRHACAVQGSAGQAGTWQAHDRDEAWRRPFVLNRAGSKTGAERVTQGSAPARAQSSTG